MFGKRLKGVVAVSVIILLCVITSGCGKTKVINGIEYDTYGLINKEDKKNEKIQYEVIWGNVIWGAILVETLVAPIYFFGFSMFEPTGNKTGIKGQLPHD